MYRRSRYEIFLDILHACAKEQTITSILRKCRLCWDQKKFLVQLNHSGFLKKDGDFYKTTNEGWIFLRELERLLKKLDTHNPLLSL